MNTNQINAKKELFIRAMEKDNKDLIHAVAPAEMMTIIHKCDPLHHHNGENHLLEISNADELCFDDYCFDMNKKEYYKLPSNIRGLRKAFGESMTDLALAIDVEKTAVSNYELGDRIPNRDVLKRIAKHFHITEDELVNGDYSNMKKMYDDSMLNQQHSSSMIEKILPCICSSRALENNNFKKAYLLEEKIFNCIINQSYNLLDKDMEKCFEYYFAAIDEKVIEASANILRQIFFVGMITCWINPKFIDEFEEIKESPKNWCSPCI